MMRKITAFVLCFLLLLGMTVNVSAASTGDAAGNPLEESVSGNTAAAFVIPDVTGMNYVDAEAALAGIPVEVIRKFAASDLNAEDEVISQSAVGTAAADEVTQVILTISEGTDGEKPQKLSEGSKRGFSAVLADRSGIEIDGAFSDWTDKPYSWEYGYDNSSEVWGGWFYVDGEAQKCETGTFNNIVRNKISLYCDGENVYVYVQLAKAYKAGFSGEDFEFTIDGQKAAFQLMAQEVDNKKPGTYTVNVKDRNSYALADGAVAKILVHEGGANNEMEVKIPLQALKTHNHNINIDNIGTIEFKASHLMYRPVTASGADTMPFLWAFLALVIVPVSAYAIHRHYGKNKKQVQTGR